MNKVISIAAVLALTSADNRLFTKQRTIPNLVAYDNEMVYFENPKDSPKHPPHSHFFLDSVRDDELFVKDANNDALIWYPPGTDPKNMRDPFKLPINAMAVRDDELDNEMVWYPLGTGPKRSSDPLGFYTKSHSLQAQDDELMMRIDPSELRPLRRPSPLVHSVQDDELFVDTANDDEMVYCFDSKNCPRRGRYPFMELQAMDDDELVWYPPSEAYKYKRNPFGPFTDVAHDDEQMMIRLDPREWKGFNTHDYELFNAEEVEGRVKKFKDTLSKHTEPIKQAQKDAKDRAEMIRRLTKDQKNGVLHDFPLLEQLIKEGRTLAHEAKAQRTQKKPQVHDNNLFIEEVQDNDLSLKDKVKGAVNWVGDHPQVISEGAKAIRTLRGGK